MDHDPLAVIEHAEVCRLAIRKHHRPRRRRLSQHTPKMKRLLRFFPAVVAGLLAGWLVSRRIAPLAGEVQSAPPVAAPASARQLSGEAKAAWQALLATRAPL